MFTHHETLVTCTSHQLNDFLKKPNSLNTVLQLLKSSSMSYAFHYAKQMLIPLPQLKKIKRHRNCTTNTTCTPCVHRISFPILQLTLYIASSLLKELIVLPLHLRHCWIYVNSVGYFQKIQVKTISIYTTISLLQSEKTWTDSKTLISKND